MGIWALIEAVCKEKDATGSSLQQKIDSLLELGVLTLSGAQILHCLRIMGNQAAHEVTPQDEKDLGVAFDVVEHLLLGVYLLPQKAAELGKKP